MLCITPAQCVSEGVKESEQETDRMSELEDIASANFWENRAETVHYF